MVDKNTVYAGTCYSDIMVARKWLKEHAPEPVYGDTAETHKDDGR